MATKLLSYMAGSESAKALAAALGIKRLKEEASVWKPKAGDVVINWGRSNTEHAAFNGRARIINPPEAIAKAANKLKAFKAFKEAGVPTPEWTEDVGEAVHWVREGNSMVVARTKLSGHSGEGIVLVNRENIVDLPRCQLYTEYVKKVNEFRLHVHKGNVFFIQRKARKKEVPDNEVNWQVRNHANGFIFANQGVDVPEGHKEAAVKAVAALGLDFGAVDLIETKKGECFVLEVNTACGMEGTTLDKYVEQFKEYV
ncbi:MAG: glutathione synthase/Ribosomal protein S6 modification [Podoviridae sp. ctbj_2]|nr:MAG: glutathione synthase/Ribosomal protein S6 modification [Podoviridae sp. ctbj_2]